MENKKDTFNWGAWVALPLILITIGIPIAVFWPQIMDFFKEENLKHWLMNMGVWAPLVFIGLQILQVVVFVIPGEVTQIAGGVLFGSGLGTIYSIIGITAGASLAFFLGRTLGMSFVKGIAGAENVQKFETLLNSPKTAIAFFFLFLIPGLPKDILAYVAGLSPLKYVTFLVLTTPARLPGILVSSVIGSSAAKEHWLMVGIIAAAALGLFGLGFIFREKLQKLIIKLQGLKEDSAPKE